MHVPYLLLLYSVCNSFTPNDDSHNFGRHLKTKYHYHMWEMDSPLLLKGSARLAPS